LQINVFVHKKIIGILPAGREFFIILINNQVVFPITDSQKSVFQGILLYAAGKPLSCGYINLYSPAGTEKTKPGVIIPEFFRL